MTRKSSDVIEEREVEDNSILSLRNTWVAFFVSAKNKKALKKRRIEKDPV
jgi:hypothetical protein